MWHVPNHSSKGENNQFIQLKPLNRLAAREEHMVQSGTLSTRNKERHRQQRHEKHIQQGGHESEE